MSRFARWIALLIALGGASAAFAQTGPMSGFCNYGGRQAAVSGLASTNYQQGIIPSCTVSVYLTGTQTLATLFSNGTGTSLSNPFTATVVGTTAPGQWTFWASNAQLYDVVVSGGIAPNIYAAPVTLIAGGGVSGSLGNFLQLSGGTMYGSLFAPNINGEVYPAACGRSPAPSWCSGSTPDAWVRAACTQLPAAGGIINLLGLTGNWAASAPCSTPTKQVIMLADNTSRVNITESDGGIAIPLDNGSMLLGQGAGQCNFTNNGIHLASGANVTAIAGPAHTDGTQENFTVSGACLFGAAGATVSQGLLYSNHEFANTTFDGNVISVCNTACVKILNNGQTKLTNNWLNVADGLTSITGTPLVIQGSGLGNGCNVGPIDVSGGQIEHALGGGAEILVKGDGTGGPLACDIHVHDLGVERNPAGTPGVVGVQIEDCRNCSVANVLASGTNSGSQAMVKILQNIGGAISNVTLQNISNVFGSYANTLSDTTPSGVLLSSFGAPYIATYYSNPGYVQPPVLPGTIIQSVGSDVMAGLGSFSTGTGTFGTSFSNTGCLNSQGLTCTYTRTSTSPPPGNTFSQQAQITANSDTGTGFNGVQYGPTVSFTAGQAYTASFWGKGDGSFTGLPTFLLWNSTTNSFYCQGTASSAFTSAWTLYSFNCTPNSSGSAFLAVAAQTPAGATGTFWVGGFIFSPVTPLTPGNLLQSITPYGVGPASAGEQQVAINGVTCQLQGSCTIPGTAVGTGTTGTITGTALTATCDSGTATVTGATVGHPVAVSSSTGADVGGAFNLRASVTSTNTVSVFVCGTGTPASLAYKVTVF